jgi:prepilin-type N-terminal cleavage/methylation domain-containing protein
MSRQRGFSLVEATIAMAISGLVILASMQMLAHVSMQSEDVRRMAEFQAMTRILTATLQNVNVCTSNLKGLALNPNSAGGAAATPTAVGEIDTYDTTGATKVSSLIVAGQLYQTMKIQNISLALSGNWSGQSYAALLSVTASRPDGSGTPLSGSLPLSIKTDGNNNLLSCGANRHLLETTTSTGPTPSNSASDPIIIACYNGTPTQSTCPANTTPAPNSLSPNSTLPCDCDMLPGPNPTLPIIDQSFYNPGGGTWCPDCQEAAMPQYDSPSQTCTCVYEAGVNAANWAAVMCCVGPTSAQIGYTTTNY